MMKLLFASVLLCLITQIFAQNVQFTNHDDVVKVKKGDQISITTDSAYLVSNMRAIYLNNKLDELANVKDSFNRLTGNHNNVIKILSEIQKSLSLHIANLSKENEKEKNALDAIMKDLDKSVSDLNAANHTLHNNNNELVEKIKNLEQISKKLKRQNRGIWLNGIADKIIVLAGGIGIGLFLSRL